MNKEEKIEQAIKNKNERIDRCIDRRERGIAYFNSVNSAIAVMGEYDLKEYESLEQYRKAIISWRDWFYEEWCNWYIDTITPARINEKRAVKLGDKWKKETLKEEAERKKAETAYEENTEEANKKIDQEVMDGREREAQDKLNLQ